MTDPHTTPAPGAGTERDTAAGLDADELTEPSTEKEPGEEPTAPHPDEPLAPTPAEPLAPTPTEPGMPEAQEPSHHAVGIGVIDDEA